MSACSADSDLVAFFAVVEEPADILKDVYVCLLSWRCHSALSASERRQMGARAGELRPHSPPQQKMQLARLWDGQSTLTRRPSIKAAMNSDLDTPPSPASDVSSSPRSAVGNAVEPMDLTDFIGSLNDNNEFSSSKNVIAPRSPTIRRERNSSIGGPQRDVDVKSQEKEMRRLLDTTYNYREAISIASVIMRS